MKIIGGMMNSGILQYPIIVLKKSDAMIYVYYKDFFITVKKLISFYNDIAVIDSEGFLHEFKKAEFKKNKGFSFLYLQRMVEVKPIISKKPSEISLEEMKIRLMSQVKLKPKFWLSLDTIAGIQEMVDRARTYKELILIFK